MCHLADVSRASYYRYLQKTAPKEEEMAVRAAIQEEVVRHRRHYGSRRICAALRRRGMAVNRKRVSRIMREDNLLAVRHRKFVATTDGQHEYPVFLNLAARMTVTGINQLWVADITYVRLRKEFVYLAVVLDRYSRKAIGWALSPSLSAAVTLAALRQAIETRQPPPGVVHHSDRGIPYACKEYTAELAAHQMTPSMSRPANPYDNAACESFMKTLKQEEIHRRKYADFSELEQNLEAFLDQYYNWQRLHSALGYRTPEEFEQETATQAVADSIPSAAMMIMFTRNREEKAMEDRVKRSCKERFPK